MADDRYAVQEKMRMNGSWNTHPGQGLLVAFLVMGLVVTMAVPHPTLGWLGFIPFAVLVVLRSGRFPAKTALMRAILATLVLAIIWLIAFRVGDFLTG